MIEVGRICVKIAGREAGSYCVVIEEEKNGFVVVTGPREYTGVKRRRCNVNHLEPTEHKIDIKSGASDGEIVVSLQKQGLIKKLGLVKRVIREKKRAEKAEKTQKKKKTETPKRGLLEKVKKLAPKPKEGKESTQDFDESIVVKPATKTKAKAGPKKKAVKKKSKKATKQKPAKKKK